MALILMVYGQDISETKAKFGTLMADIGLIHSTNLIGAYWYSSSKGARGGAIIPRMSTFKFFPNYNSPRPPPHIGHWESFCQLSILSQGEESRKLKIFQIFVTCFEGSPYDKCMGPTGPVNHEPIFLAYSKLVIPQLFTLENRNTSPAEHSRLRQASCWATSKEDAKLLRLFHTLGLTTFITGVKQIIRYQ